MRSDVAAMSAPSAERNRSAALPSTMSSKRTAMSGRSGGAPKVESPGQVSVTTAPASLLATVTASVNGAESVRPRESDAHAPTPSV